MHTLNKFLIAYFSRRKKYQKKTNLSMNYSSDYNPLNNAFWGSLDSKHVNNQNHSEFLSSEISTLKFLETHSEL